MEKELIQPRIVSVSREEKLETLEDLLTKEPAITDEELAIKTDTNVGTVLKMKEKSQKVKMSLTEVGARQTALMKAMLLYPRATATDLGAMIGASSATVRKWQKSEKFKTAFAEFSREELDKAANVRARLDDKILRKTEMAVDKAGEMMQNDKPLEIQMDALKVVMAQGHAKAVERSAHLSASFTISEDIMQNLINSMKDINTPFIPSKRLHKIRGDDEAIDAEIR